jgi:hypothetical protein
MEIKLGNKDKKEQIFDIGMWQCMKISFFAGLGWTLLYIGILALIVILSSIFDAI